MKEYYAWIREIQKNKIDVNLRLAFIDWCGENGHQKTANRQKIAIDAIRKAYVIYTIRVAKTYNKQSVFKEDVIEVYGLIQSGKNNEIRGFKLHNDGTVVFEPRGLSGRAGIKKHVIKGSFKDYKPTAIDKARKAEQIAKSSNFAKFYGVSRVARQSEGSTGILDESSSFKIVDGQHRLNALRSLAGLADSVVAGAIRGVYPRPKISEALDYKSLKAEFLNPDLGIPWVTEEQLDEALKKNPPLDLSTPKSDSEIFENRPRRNLLDQSQLITIDIKQVEKELENTLKNKKDAFEWAIASAEILKENERLLNENGSSINYPTDEGKASG